MLQVLWHLFHVLFLLLPYDGINYKNYFPFLYFYSYFKVKEFTFANRNFRTQVLYFSCCLFAFSTQ